MRFDNGMTRRGEHLVRVPACIGSRFDGLIGEENQLGTGL
jgi:hypothetical protein